MAKVSTPLNKNWSEPNSTASSLGFKVDSTFESLHKILNGEHEIKAVDHYFPVVLFFCADQTLNEKIIVQYYDIMFWMITAFF